MAQNSKISALTDELINSILKFDPASNRQAYKHAKEIAARGLRRHQYARTNQFDVSANFAGLDEKFRVKNRDDLADALRTRLKKLELATNKFTPDLLSFLLQLSDRPLENTKVEALELLRPPSPPPELTWNEILHDDPYSDDDIWKDIDYAVESSGDEQKLKRRAKTKSSPPTSVEGEDMQDTDACVIPVNALLVKEIEAAHFWSTVAEEEDAQVEITELQAVRETLFMLAGLQTSLYQRDKYQDNIHINPRYVLGHAMYATLEHLLSDFVSIGRRLYRLRQWTKRRSALPLIQTFEAAVQNRLRLYDCSLARLQERYLSPSCATMVSLLDMYTAVHAISAPLLRLAKVVSDIEPNLLVNPFSHLESLFEQTTLAQMTLEIEIFHYLSDVFFECLQTYLKPIRNWMDAGDLGFNDETFFVFESDSGSESASLWHDRYVLRRDAQGQPRSPSFLQPASKKIFNTGKGVILLRELGVHSLDMDHTHDEPKVDHVTVCGSTDDVPLSPFPELFEMAFDKWMRSKYSQASAVLRAHISETGGLIRTLIIFETLYLGKNGAVFEGLANALFERIDSGRKGWNDRYVLTDLAREVFGTIIPRSDVDNVVVRSSKTKSDNKSVKALHAVSIDYALPWVVQNIIQRSSIPTYQQVFTFLLQVYRTKYLLQRARPTRTRASEAPTTKLNRRLQHRLIWFTDTLRSYLTETAMFFTTQDMYIAMQEAEDIDDMAQTHINYVAKLQTRALLSKDLKLIHNAIIEVLDLGVLLAKTDVDQNLGKEERSAGNNAIQTMRKSKAPVLAAQELSDSDGDNRSDKEDSPEVAILIERSPAEVLQIIDEEFERLVPFIVAGLKSVGRGPDDACWPSQNAWKQLNDQVEGRLIKSEPIALPCYPGPAEDRAACDSVVANWTSDVFQSSQPLGLSYPTNTTCPPVNYASGEVPGTCSLGNNPRYAVNATTAAHIRHTIAFAKKHNVRLVVKSTGHDINGRSDGYGSLEVWLHYHRTGIDFQNIYTPANRCNRSTWNGIAIKIRGGYQWRDVYAVAKEKNVIVVGGGTPSVGAVGGWATGGGHGPASRNYGLGADQILEAEVVLADGRVVIANACENADLYRAYRGGGPGYGVALSFTMKAYPNVDTIAVQRLEIAPLAGNNSALFDALAILFQHYPSMNDAGLTGSGSWFLNSIAPIFGTTSVGYYHVFYAIGKEVSETENSFAPVRQALDGLSASISINETYSAYHDYWTFYEAKSGLDDPVGNEGALTSRLFDPASLSDHAKVRKYVETVSGKPQDYVSNVIDMVSGGQVFEDANDPYSGLHPAWRTSPFLHIVAEGWAPGSSDDIKTALRSDVTNVKGAAQKAIAPNTGGYMNEGDRFDPEWKQTFYGANYEAHLATKKRYDPEGLFYCPTCVGSDEWIDIPGTPLCGAG